MSTESIQHFEVVLKHKQRNFHFFATVLALNEQQAEELTKEYLKDVFLNFFNVESLPVSDEIFWQNSEVEVKNKSNPRVLNFSWDRMGKTGPVRLGLLPTKSHP